MRVGLMIVLLPVVLFFSTAGNASYLVPINPSVTVDSSTTSITLGVNTGLGPDVTTYLFTGGLAVLPKYVSSTLPAGVSFASQSCTEDSCYLTLSIDPGAMDDTSSAPITYDDNMTGAATSTITFNKQTADEPPVINNANLASYVMSEEDPPYSQDIPIDLTSTPGVNPGTDESGDAATITGISNDAISNGTEVDYALQSDPSGTCGFNTGDFKLSLNSGAQTLTVAADNPFVDPNCDGAVISIPSLTVTNNNGDPDTDTDTQENAFPITLFSNIVMPGGDIANDANDSPKDTDPVVQCADATGPYASTYSHLFTTDELAPTTGALWESGLLDSILIGADDDDVKTDFNLTLTDNAFTLNQTSDPISCQYAGYQAAVVMTVNDDNPNTETNTTTPYTFYVTDSPDVPADTISCGDTLDVGQDLSACTTLLSDQVNPGHDDTDDSKMVFDDGGSSVTWEASSSPTCASDADTNLNLSVIDTTATLVGQIPATCVGNTLTATVTLKNTSPDFDSADYGETATATYTVDVSNTQHVTITCPDAMDIPDRLYPGSKSYEGEGDVDVTIDYGLFGPINDNQYYLDTVTYSNNALVCSYSNSLRTSNAIILTSSYPADFSATGGSVSSVEKGWEGGSCDANDDPESCELTATVTLD